MRIRLLGTGAAEGIPALYAGTRVSEYARQHGGREVRSRCAALIDGHLKIDLPPDTLMQCHRDGLDARNWSILVFTHSHDDHFALMELQYGLSPFSDTGRFLFPIYGNAEVCRMIREQYPQWPSEVYETQSFRSFTHSVTGVGHEDWGPYRDDKSVDYTIIPIAANHKDDEDSHNLLIESEGKCLLYGTDTGVWKEPTWEFLQDKRVDLLILECTEGFKGSDYHGHLDVIECLHMRDRLIKQGTLQEGFIMATTHHSHNGDATYSELEEALAKEGVIAGYDGLEISF